MGSAPGHLVGFEEAIGIVLARAAMVETPGTERVLLLESAGRVLATGVSADRDQPGFDRSTRDGFALRAEEWGTRLQVVGQVRAGEDWRGGSVDPGTALEIMTGARMPQGVDSVVMVEHVVRDGAEIRPGDSRVISAGENVVPRGSEARQGDPVLLAGTRVGAAEIALAATCGCAELEVYAWPTVAIVSTGDELVDVSEQPEAWQIRNSNSYAIAAMVVAAGGQPVRLGIARDVGADVRARILEGGKADLLVFSGGVSMGEYDLVEEVLAEFDAEFFFTGVKMQPGKPVVFGRLPERDGREACYFFGLPGNPISTQVTFHCFAELLVRALSGEKLAGPKWALAEVSESVEGKPGLTRVLPARMEGVGVRPVKWQGSGDLAANARANCYVELLPGRSYAAGEVVRVLLR